MLKYVGSAETVHFVNWLLYSGHVDPAALVHKATEEATAELANREWTPEEQEEYLAEELPNRLANTLEEALAECVGEFSPDYNHYDEWDFGDSLEFFQGADACQLFAPLLARAIDGIDFGYAAEHILAHVNQVAEVA